MGACVPGRNTRLCLNWRGSRAYRPCAGSGLWWSGSRNTASGGTRGVLPRCTPRANPAARSRQLAPHLFEARKHWEFPGGLRVCDLTGETSRRGVTFHSPDCWRSARARNSNACCNRANPSPHRISACSAETPWATRRMLRQKPRRFWAGKSQVPIRNTARIASPESRSNKSLNPAVRST